MVIDIKDRVKNVDLQGKIVTAYDAAQLINPNDKVGISGFTHRVMQKLCHWHWQKEWKKNHSKSICGQVLL